MWHDHPIIRQSDIELLEISLHVTELNESIKNYAKSHKRVTENRHIAFTAPRLACKDGFLRQVKSIVKNLREAIDGILTTHVDAEAIRRFRETLTRRSGLDAHDEVAGMCDEAGSQRFDRKFP